ncbi:uncharacterized protein LOC103696372 isoform X1 [Phoenix dactylifera]|uniref:Uncharacterized protein LOC103696372 isoform X1 n=1 Tax=Phoenix dactylifera TaxID=42345 RepID=A0A8B7BGF8_PHODC|nr:uncharacterized protein LOC103696372 isoform X1 [Phoenix dactylifera]
MDILALNTKGGGLVLGAARKKLEKGLVSVRQIAGCRLLVGEEEAPVFGGGFEIRVSARGAVRLSSFGNRSFVVRASGKKKDHNSSSSSAGNNDPSIPEGDGSEGIHPLHDESKSSDSIHKSHYTLSDWRDVRAKLVRDEQVQLLDPDVLAKGTASDEPSQRLGLNWAHSLSMPEAGCLLVATEKLDGLTSFERAVVLLLRLGTRDPREGPFGVILNRPLNRKIKHMKPSNPDLATTFADCSLYFGGPLDASMFLLKTSGNSSIQGCEQVLPGIFFGARHSLNEAAALVKKGVLGPQDFRFFVGYSGWQFDQLQEEIGLGYWVVAACSSHLINEALAGSSSNLWEEILQRMGGQYSELSRKPKQDSF